LKAGEPEGAGADEDFDDFSGDLSALAAGDGDGEDRLVEPALSA
jgi:hypothetical protein